MKKPIPSSLLDLRRQFLSFLERRIDDRALAEDILQTAYVRALESSGRLREQESAVAWFYRILRNAIIDHYRRRTSERSALDRWAQELELEPVADPLLTDTACQCIERALDRSPRLCVPAARGRSRGISLAAYAAAHNITPGYAAVRAHRARAACAVHSSGVAAPTDAWNAPAIPARVRHCRRLLSRQPRYITNAYRLSASAPAY